MDLPTGSTPVDFAYAIHSDLGEHMQGAKINNKLVSFDTELKNGDMVEIIKSKNARPTAKWHDYARTSLARRNIRSYLENNARTDTSLVEIKPLRVTKRKTPKGTKPSKQ